MAQATSRPWPGSRGPVRLGPRRRVPYGIRHHLIELGRKAAAKGLKSSVGSIWAACRVNTLPGGRVIPISFSFEYNLVQDGSNAADANQAPSTAA
jgi:hypothetical protein